MESLANEMTKSDDVYKLLNNPGPEFSQKNKINEEESISLQRREELLKKYANVTVVNDPSYKKKILDSLLLLFFRKYPAANTSTFGSTIDSLDKTSFMNWGQDLHIDDAIELLKLAI